MRLLRVLRHSRGSTSSSAYTVVKLLGNVAEIADFGPIKGVASLLEQLVEIYMVIKVGIYSLTSSLNGVVIGNRRK